MIDIESLFILHSEFENIFNTKTNEGLSYLKDKKIVFAGLCRSVGNIIETNLNKIINTVKNKCLDYKIVLFENDSNDDTITKLNNLCKYNNNIHVISQILNRKQYAATKEVARTEAFAEYRNILKEHIKKHYKEYDFVIIFDTDFIDFSSLGFYNSFGWLSNNNNVSAVCGNSFQIKKIFGENDILRLWNYDSWAFRMSWWTNLQTYNISNFPQMDPMLWFGFWIPPKGSAPIKINSGFGGMAIYRTKFYLIGNYNGIDCEHVTFHYDIVNKNSKFNLFLNPSQIMIMS